MQYLICVKICVLGEAHFSKAVSIFKLNIFKNNLSAFQHFSKLGLCQRDLVAYTNEVESNHVSMFIFKTWSEALNQKFISF